MALSLPARFRRFNTPSAVAAPAAVRLLATRATGDDGAVIVLAADVAGHSFDWCKRHALLVLDALIAKFPGAAVDVQLLADDNTPLLLVTGGAS